MKQVNMNRPDKRGSRIRVCVFADLASRVGESWKDLDMEFGIFVSNTSSRPHTKAATPTCAR
jgi:hypothetical protein